MTTKTDERRAEAIRELRKMLKVGDTVYTQLVSVSRSGMSRKIAVKIARGGQIIDITHYAALATSYTIDRDAWALKVGGAGMDMGYHVVYSLGRAMWPKGHRCTTRKEVALDMLDQELAHIRATLPENGA